MNDEQLQTILDAFTQNENEFCLETKSFRIVSDHTLFRVSFYINDDFIINRNKGKNEKITVDERLNVDKLMEEIKVFQSKNKPTDTEPTGSTN